MVQWPSKTIIQHGRNPIDQTTSPSYWWWTNQITIRNTYSLTIMQMKAKIALLMFAISSLA